MSYLEIYNEVRWPLSALPALMLQQLRFLRHPQHSCPLLEPFRSLDKSALKSHLAPGTSHATLMPAREA